MIPSRNSQRGVGHTRILVVATLLPFFLFLNICPGHAQAPAPAAGGGSYWICRAMPGDGSSYYSDIFAAPDSAYSDMAKGFTQFLAAKYNQKNGVPTCIHYVSDQQAQTYMKQFAAGAKSVLTGWKFGQTAAAPAQAAAPTSSQPPAQPAPPATAAAAAPAPTPAAQAPPASATIAMRMVDLVNSATDPPDKQYRAVVTQAATAGSVSIPVNTEARITLAQSGGTWSAQLISLSLNSQTVPVTSSSVSASSPIQQVAEKAKSVFGINLGNVAPKAAVATAIATGDHVFLPVGAVLTFTASVPQPSAQVSAGAAAAPTSAPATTSAVPVAAASAPTPVNGAPQATGQVFELCEMATPTHTYVSAIFSGDYKDKAKWEVAFANYVYTNFDKLLGNGGCTEYQSAAQAQRILQNMKNQPSYKILETGWVYKGPEPGPPAPKSNPNNGK